MIENIPFGSPEGNLAEDLERLLRRDWLPEPEGSVHIGQEGGRLLAWIMGADTGMLGLMLATLSRPSELDDPASLSRRITPGDRESPDPEGWEIRLYPTRFPSDRSIMFSLKIYVPFSDLPEVIARLGGETDGRG